MSANETVRSDSEKEREIEMLRETRFVDGSEHEGIRDVIDKTVTARYITANKVVLEGEFIDGMFHGHGSIYWPRGQIMNGVWNRGKMEQKRYIFSDGLTYQEDDWNYCRFPDRRFYKCIVDGLKPAGRVLKTNDQPTKVILPFCYDTGIGIFDPDTNCITSYHNHKKILKIPTTTESTWIKEHCRTGWSKPTGHQVWLQKYWQSGAADFAMLPQISPQDQSENWWRRLTTFTRYSPSDKMDKIKLYH